MRRTLRKAPREATRARGFEYVVCTSQFMKVTFINGEYQGRVHGTPAGADACQRMLDSCPDLPSVLDRLGAEGWELVAAYAAPYPDGVLEKFVLKRPL